MLELLVEPINPLSAEFESELLALDNPPEPWLLDINRVCSVR